MSIPDKNGFINSFATVQRKGDALELPIKLYYDNRSQQVPGVALLTQLKYKHIFLTSYSKMRVDLAAQVKKIALLMLCLYYFLFM